MSKILLSITILIATLTTQAQITNASDTIDTNKTATQPVVETKWGNIVFSSDKTLIENTKLAPQLSTYAGLLENSAFTNDLAQPKATVFVVANDYFDAMSKKKRKAFLSPANASRLNEAIKMYIIPGRMDSRTLEIQIEKNGGNPVFLKTANGESLGVQKRGKKLQLIDNKGNKANIIASDFYHSTGFFHVVDTLLYEEDK